MASRKSNANEKNKEKSTSDHAVLDFDSRDELARLRRENDNLHASLREHTKKISIMESDKVELETKVKIFGK